VSLDGFKLSVNWWIGLVPDDSPLVVRDAGMREIYALDVEWP
jgi:hypothetical protein